MWRESFTNPELEFLAEQTLIEVFPNFKKEPIELSSGTYGPFKPNKKTVVPLWFAIQLKKNKKCKIVVPSFLEQNFLQDTLETEKNEKSSLFPLPDYFFEVAQILFSEAGDDFLDLKETRGTVEDIAAIRNEKINKTLEEIKTDELHFKVENYNQREIEQIRPFLTGIFNKRISILEHKPVSALKDLLFAKPIIDNETGEDIQVEEQKKNHFKEGFGEE